MGKQPPAQGFQPMKEASTNYADGPWVPGFTVEDGIAAKEAGLREARKLAPLGEITEPTPAWQDAERQAASPDGAPAPKGQGPK